MAPRLVLCNHGLRHAGGIERYLLTLVRGLHERGQRPVVVVKSIDLALEEAGWVEPVTVSVAWLPGKLRDSWFDFRLRRLKARHGWFPLVALNQTAAADIAISGSNHPAYLAAMGRSVGWWDRRKIELERAHLQGARVVIAHSRMLADHAMREFGVAMDKIVVAYPPVDTQRFRVTTQSRRQELRRELGLRDDQCVFLLASTGHARKGLDLAVSALAGLDAMLLVAGRPPDRHAPNLRHIGYRSAMENIYPAVDFTLVPSRYEPFGLVGIESVLCGTPVVAEHGVGFLEVLDREAAITFDADKTDSFRTAIDAALARFADRNARIDEPLHHIRYDPSVQAHLDILLGWVARLTDTSSPSARHP